MQLTVWYADHTLPCLFHWMYCNYWNLSCNTIAQIFNETDNITSKLYSITIPRSIKTWITVSGRAKLSSYLEWILGTCIPTCSECQCLNPWQTSMLNTFTHVFIFHCWNLYFLLNHTNADDSSLLFMQTSISML